MSERAAVLVHGATGFTGKLVCGVLARKNVLFAIAGRSKEKLEALAKSFEGQVAAPVEIAVIDLHQEATIRAALENRKVVCACAGPFIDVGEPVLAMAARLGVHYADTTGEQKFVALAVSRYRATAEASGACVTPAMAYEIAIGDWAAHAAAQKLGENADEINVVYMNQPEDGMSAATSRGTKLSMIAMTADGDPRQFLDGELRSENAAAVVREFVSPSGKKMWSASFPSPESVVVPSHTGAKNVRTFMAMAKGAAKAMQATRSVTPSVMRLFKAPLEKWIAKSSAGPEGASRNARFHILAEATKGNRTERVFISGSDPYGVTGEIQALFAERAITGKITARGVVAPSVAIAFDDAKADLDLTLS
jgi:short subunit dehydrogenase-like uncharacterized protein